MGTGTGRKIGVVSDDLTSAADAIAPFVMRGVPGWIGRGRLPKASAPVLAVDSGSRSVSAEKAAARVANFAAQLAATYVLFKTVDSTLRGHVTVELDAAFTASGRDRLVFAPAFPAAGRITSGGIQLVDNVPVSETVYGQDPIHPARHSLLADLVPNSIRNIVLIDATSQEELNARVAALPDPETILWAGSPGLAEALARRFAPVSNAGSNPATVCGEIVVAVGSANPCSHRQADQIGEIHGVTLFRAPKSREGNSRTIVADLAEAVAKKVREDSVDAVIATGGETMAAILDLLDIQELKVLAELDQGFPLACGLLSDGRTMLIALKAGGFGNDDALQRAIGSLRRENTALFAVTE